MLSPEIVERLAREKGFLIRRSKLLPLDFLKMLLLDHLQSDQPSLQQHCLGLFNCGTQISKQGIDKRFNNESVAFIQSLFEYYLNYQISHTPLSTGLCQSFKAIRIMDSTQFKLPAKMATEFSGYDGDGTEACAQLQFEYDLLSGKVIELSIDKARVADVTYAYKSNRSVQPGELVLRDLGYWTFQSYKDIDDRDAFYVSRLKAQANIYEKKDGSFVQLSAEQIIERLQNSKEKYLDIPVYIGSEVKTPTRLIANLLDQQAINRRIRRKNVRKGKLTKRDELWTKHNVFVTNISTEKSSAEGIYNLYKLRWQIELIFKSWKSILKIHLVKPMKVERFKCYLISKLIWIMLNWDMFMSFSDKILQTHTRIISLYKCFSIVKSQAKLLIQLIFRRKKSKLRIWLAKLYNSISNYALKEERKGRISLKFLLKH